MIPFSFIHASDLHLDTPFTGIGKVNAALQQRLRDASLTAFDNLIRAAISHEVDFVLLAGDIYDGVDRGVRAQARFLKGVRQLDQHDIGCLFIHGNHDPVAEGWSALRREDFPPSAVLFEQNDKVRSELALRGSEALAVVHGISFRTKKETRNLSLLFPASRTDEAFHIGLLHCNVGGQLGHDDYAPCTLDDLRGRGIDYWALGHIHERTELSSSNPVVLYPGNLQARRFDERGQKGAMLVSVETRDDVKTQFLALDEVRFAQVDVDVTGRQSLDETLADCAAKANRAVAEIRPRLLVARITLKGQTAAHYDLLVAHAKQELLPTLRDRLSNDDLWLDQVSVRTLPAVDRAKVEKSGGFEGALVQLVDTTAMSEADLIALQESVRNPLLRSPQFRNVLVEIDAAYARDVVNQAEARLLGMLEVEAER